MSEPARQHEWSDRLGEEAPKWKYRPIGSWNCERMCHKEVTVTTGPMAGARVAGSFGEVDQEVGPNWGIMEPGVASALVGMVDGLGLGAAGVPRNISMVIEAYNRERITRDQTDGIDLTWGNYEGAIELLEKAVRREGIGAILAKPIKEAAKELGIEDLAVHMKGTGGNDHDLRYHPGLLFGVMLHGAGPNWGNAIRTMEFREHIGTQVGGEPDLGYDEPIPSDNPESLKVIPKHSYDGMKMRMWEDSVGVCWSSFRAYKGVIEQSAKCVAAATGWKGFNREEALRVGERVGTLARLISLNLGYKAEHDFDISDRFLTVPDDWPARPDWWPYKDGKPMSYGPLMKQWFEEYYGYLNWDPQTGVPSPEALQELGIANFKVGKK